MPSRPVVEPEMLGVRWGLTSLGDLIPEVDPLGPAVSVALGRSMVKLSREGIGKCLADEVWPAAEGGESPVEDGDMFWVLRRSCVEDVMGRVRSGAADQAMNRVVSRVGSGCWIRQLVKMAQEKSGRPVMDEPTGPETVEASPDRGQSQLSSES